MELTLQAIKQYEKVGDLLNSYCQKIATTDYNKNHLKITNKRKWIRNISVNFYITNRDTINVAYDDFYGYINDISVPISAFLNDKTIEDYCLNVL